MTFNILRKKINDLYDSCWQMLNLLSMKHPSERIYMPSDIPVYIRFKDSVTHENGIDEQHYTLYNIKDLIVNKDSDELFDIYIDIEEIPSKIRTLYKSK